MASITHPGEKRQRTRLDPGKQLLQCGFLVIALLLTAAALWPAAVVYSAFAPRSDTALAWVALVIACILVFNYAYLVLLLALRIVLPRPKEGFYPPRKDGRPPREVALLMLNILLTKLRYNPPWAPMISSVLVTLPPLHAAFRHFFGPHTRSLTFGDSTIVLDPYLLYAGKNVQFGFRSFMSGHIFDNRGMLIKRVVVEDDAVIGGFASLLPGVHVGHHSIVAFASVVKPNTMIGPYELSAGSPAKKIRDLPRGDAATSAAGAGTGAGLQQGREDGTA